MKFLKDYWQIITALVGVIFGYANFTGEIKANAENIKRVESDYKEYKSKTDEKLDHLIRVTERIDERTNQWQKRK